LLASVTAKLRLSAAAKIGATNTAISVIATGKTAGNKARPVFFVFHGYFYLRHLSL